MKKRFILIGLLSTLFMLDTTAQNTAEKLLTSDEKLSIGGYAQIDYNQPISSDYKNNGTMDVHRMVLLFSYRFNERTQFVTEIEYEHVKEVFVEQAFLNYRISDWLNFRGGLLLIPMGIINEYHEPAVFNGVERPNLDSKIIPTTWREIGAGFTGRIQEFDIKYQAYMVNGFKSYDGEGMLHGSDAFRKGRQKGAESILTSPNFATKIEYYGIPGLNLGLSGYFGKTQSSLFENVRISDTNENTIADSSVVNTSMAGVDGRYSIKGWQFRAQANYAVIGNTKQYNQFTGKDLGSALFGYYLEAGYDFLNGKDMEQKLIPFVRYEKYNTHHKVDGISQNQAYNREEITVGVGLWLTSGAVLKGDIQWFSNETIDTYKKQINIGIGIWF